MLPVPSAGSVHQRGPRWDGAYGRINGGDLVSCSYTVNNNNYTDRHGQKVYGLVLLVSEIALLETKASKGARRARANNNTSAA